MDDGKCDGAHVGILDDVSVGLEVRVIPGASGADAVGAADGFDAGWRLGCIVGRVDGLRDGISKGCSLGCAFG